MTNYRREWLDLQKTLLKEYQEWGEALRIQDFEAVRKFQGQMDIYYSIDKLNF